MWTQLPRGCAAGAADGADGGAARCAPMRPSALERGAERWSLVTSGGSWRSCRWQEQCVGGKRRLGSSSQRRGGDRGRGKERDESFGSKEHKQLDRCVRFALEGKAAGGTFYSDDAGGGGGRACAQHLGWPRGGAAVAAAKQRGASAAAAAVREVRVRTFRTRQLRPTENAYGAGVGRRTAEAAGASVRRA
eukprot:366269-Chlamydomonas_euryale.AAC.5